MFIFINYILFKITTLYLKLQPLYRYLKIHLIVIYYTL